MDWSQFNAEEIDLEFNKNPKRVKFENVDEIQTDLNLKYIFKKIQKLREEVQETLNFIDNLHYEISLITN